MKWNLLSKQLFLSSSCSPRSSVAAAGRWSSQPCVFFLRLCFGSDRAPVGWVYDHVICKWRLLLLPFCLSALHFCALLQDSNYTIQRTRCGVVERERDRTLVNFPAWPLCAAARQQLRCPENTVLCGGERWRPCVFPSLGAKLLSLSTGNVSLPLGFSNFPVVVVRVCSLLQVFIVTLNALKCYLPSTEMIIWTFPYNVSTKKGLLDFRMLDQHGYWNETALVVLPVSYTVASS